MKTIKHCLLLMLLFTWLGQGWAQTQPVAGRARGDTAQSLGKIRAALKSGVPVKVVCLGDSVTGVYYHTGSRRAYTDMLGIALRKSMPTSKVEAINAGISGNTTTNGLDRLDRDVLSHKPNLVTIMFGLNDMTRIAVDVYRQNLISLIRQCRAAGAEVLLATPNNVIDTSSRPTAKLVEYCEVIRSVGDQLQVPVCDIYRHMEILRDSDARSWRLLMSDEIHPNMDGHKLIAEQLAQTITGLPVSLSDVPPPAFSLARLRSVAASGKVIRVLAMPPWDKHIETLLKERISAAKVEVTAWPTANLSLTDVEKNAKDRVRAFQPDLVVIDVPIASLENTTDDDQFIHSFAWIMNWSLNFGPPTWDCIVVHPAVSNRANLNSTSAISQTVRQLVRAQDLPIVDRTEGNVDDPIDLLRNWLDVKQ